MKSCSTYGGAGLSVTPQTMSNKMEYLIDIGFPWEVLGD